MAEALNKTIDVWEVTPDRGQKLIKEFKELRQQLIKFTMKQSLRKKEYKHFINKLIRSEQYLINLMWYQCNKNGKRANLDPNRTITFKGINKAEWLQNEDEWVTMLNDTNQ